MKFFLITLFTSTLVFSQKPNQLMMIPSLELERGENNRQYTIQDKTLKLNRNFHPETNELKYRTSKNTDNKFQMATLKYTSDTKKYIESISESESVKDYPMSITRYTHSPYTRDSFITQCLEHHNPNAKVYQECFSVNNKICQELDYNPSLFNRGNQTKQVKEKRTYLRKVMKLLENEEKLTKAGRNRTHYMSVKQRDYFSELYQKEKNLWQKLTEGNTSNENPEQRSSRDIIINAYHKVDKLYSGFNTGTTSLIDQPLAEFKKIELQLNLTLRNYRDLCDHAKKAEIFTPNEEYAPSAFESSSRQ